MNKTYTFEDEPCIEVELELDYTYSHTPAKTDGRPEDCYEAEEECEIRPQADYKDRIRAAYAREAEQAIYRFEKKISDLESEKAPKLWSEEEKENGLRGMIDGFFEMRKAA